MEPIRAIHKNVMLPIFFLAVSISWTSAAINNDNSTASSSPLKNCAVLNRILLEQSNACRCFDSSTFASSTDPALVDVKDDDGDADQHAPSYWIGCSRDNMPAVFRALTALPNEINLTQLWIWDAFIPRMPARSFATVRPKKLIIERCHTGDFNGIDVFAPLADRLTELELKNNVLNDISAELLAPLRRLVRLDLSVNYFTRVTNATFGKSAPNLRSLSLYRNQIESIADGSLDNFQQLRSLNLANNRLTKLTAAMFKNLRNLEYLNLENNQISEIDDDAFAQLTNLRVLNLGGNRVRSINFPTAMPRLRQLFLNNNTLDELDAIRSPLDDVMPNLETLHLDQNQLRSLASGKPNGGLRRWPTLQVLSVASNRLAALKAADFDGLKQLRTLSLQGNELTTLDGEENDGEAIAAGPFARLDMLTELFLSGNRLTALDGRTFDGLSELRVLTVARNNLETVDEKAFDGLKRLEKLFLNDNNLSYVSNATFDDVRSSLKIIDLSDNPWRCECKLVWLMKWVSSDSQDNAVVNAFHTMCDDRRNRLIDHDTPKSMSLFVNEMTASCERKSNAWDPDVSSSLIPTSNNVWITVLGIVLGVVSVCILLAVSYLYFQDAAKGGGAWRVGDSSANSGGGGGVTSSVFGRWTASGVVLRGEHALRRVPSDMVNLIPKLSTANSSSAASTNGEKM